MNVIQESISFRQHLRRRKFLPCCWLIIVFCLATPLACATETNHDPANNYPRLLNYGILNTLKGVNYDDARIAIEMNFNRQNNSMTPRFETTLEILSDVSEAARRLRERRLHGLSITGIDYILLREMASIEPLFVTSKLIDSPLEPYVLLARQGIELKTLATMEKTRLIVENDNSWDIGRIWLETALHDTGLPQSDLLFGTIQASHKPTRIVLPVFFGQAEACLVSQSAYETMVELNPQLGKKLRVLLSSPGFVKSLICAVDYLDPEFMVQMKENVRNMHKTADGRQLLTIFRHRRNFPFTPEILFETERILHKYKKIRPSFFSDSSKVNHPLAEREN